MEEKATVTADVAIDLRTPRLQCVCLWEKRSSRGLGTGPSILHKSLKKGKPVKLNQKQNLKTTQALLSQKDAN